MSDPFDNAIGWAACAINTHVWDCSVSVVCWFITLYVCAYSIGSNLYALMHVFRWVSMSYHLILRRCLQVIHCGVYFILGCALACAPTYQLQLESVLISMSPFLCNGVNNCDLKVLRVARTDRYSSRCRIIHAQVYTRGWRVVDFFASDIAHDMLLHVLFLVANAALCNVNEGVVFTFTCAFVHHFLFYCN